MGRLLGKHATGSLGRVPVRKRPAKKINGSSSVQTYAINKNGEMIRKDDSNGGRSRNGDINGSNGSTNGNRATDNGSPDNNGSNGTPTLDPVGPTPCGPTGCPPGQKCVDGKCVDPESGSSPEPEIVKVDEDTDSDNNSGSGGSSTGPAPVKAEGQNKIDEIIEPLKEVDQKVWYGLGGGFALILLMQIAQN